MEKKMVLALVMIIGTIAAIFVGSSAQIVNPQVQNETEMRLMVPQIQNETAQIVPQIRNETEMPQVVPPQTEATYYYHVMVIGTYSIDYPIGVCVYIENKDRVAHLFRVEVEMESEKGVYGRMDYAELDPGEWKVLTFPFKNLGDVNVDIDVIDNYYTI